MKIQIFDRVRDVILDKFNLKRPSIVDEIPTAYFVNFREAFTETTYFYVRTKDGKEALYLHPGYKLIAGERFLDKSQLEQLPKKTYKNREDLVRNESTDSFFYRMLGNYVQNRTQQLSNNRYHNGFSYLTSLYYGENKNFAQAYEELYKAVKKECDNLGVIYEMDPEKIMQQKLERAYNESEFKANDIRICTSKESVDNYFKTHILEQTDRKKLSREVSTLAYLKQDFTMSYCGEFLTKSDTLINALIDRSYPKREEILKNYMEFFISKDIAFGLVNYLGQLAYQADEIQFKMDQERFNNNFKFMEDLEKMIKHDTEKETYRYHATTSLEDAKRILDEGFYSYSKDLGSTSFAEFDINQILAYSYGNGTENFGDFIIVISEPKEEDIVEELTEEEQEQVQIVPRRNAVIGNKPPYKVDKKHIVGIIDKKHETVTLNPQYINNSKKQINV